MKKVLIALALFILSYQTTAFCQGDNAILSNAVSKLKTELTGNVIEKAYLQFDRPYTCYVAGEIVYFKAFVTMGEMHELSTISGVLHVDLIDKNNTVMQSIALQLNNGLGWGDFSLPDTLQKGNYRIRAYTQWMQNNKYSYIFDQYISVGSINNINQASASAKQSAKPELQFFPEGGNLVADLPSKVAFKAIGADGLGINVNGTIVDNENKEVIKIVSTHLGMGVFSFTPEQGKTYKAKLAYADGSKATVNLPEIEAKGITLAVSYDNPAKVSIEIKANRDYYKENLNKDLNILIYSGGNVRTVSTKMDNSILGLDLPANGFHTGILQVTLLSATGEPLNERLVFIQNPDLLNLWVGTNKPSYNKQENVQLNLNAKNKDGKAVNGSFAISVVDESKVAADENAENTITSYLLLKSELKGYVEQPNYYFSNTGKDTRADLDGLMLTQGYRRFAWKQLLDNTTPAATAKTFNPEKYVEIAGVLQTKTGAPLANNTIMLIEGNGGSVVTQTTDIHGHFNFANMVFYNNTRYIIKTQSTNTGKNALVLTLDKPVHMPVSTEGDLLISKYNTNADVLASLQNSQPPGVMTANNEPGRLLLKGNSNAENSNKNNGRSTKLSGSGNADQVVMASQLLPGPSLSGGLNGILRGIEFTSGVPYLKSSQVVNAGSVGAEPMLVLVDGVQSSNVDVVEPTNVESVEILRGPNAGIYGVRGASGVLIINTKQANSNFVASKETAPGIFSITPQGFYKAREFYSPATEASEENKPADAHTTVFWKPDVTTDANGNASFNFLNSGSAGTYSVVVEGIDDKGNLGRQVYTYKVL